MKIYQERMRNGESAEYYYPNLIAELKKKNIKLSQLAQGLKMNYYTFSRKINGRGTFDVEECFKICEILGNTFEYLFFSPYKKEDVKDGEN